jgi:hypothetical protein
MKIDSAICAQIEIIGMGIVPPEVREYKSFSDVYSHTLSYSRVDVSKALSVLNASDAVTAKRKFRKLFRKACEWRLQQITLNFESEMKSAKARKLPAYRREKIKERFVRRIEAFKRSVGIDKPQEKISSYKMRSRKDLVVNYILEEKINA